MGNETEKLGVGEKKREEKGSIQESSQVSSLGDWLVDAVIPTEMKVPEEDDGYSWGHPVGVV